MTLRVYIAVALCVLVGTMGAAATTEGGADGSSILGISVPADRSERLWARSSMDGSPSEMAMVLGQGSWRDAHLYSAHAQEGDVPRLVFAVQGCHPAVASVDWGAAGTTLAGACGVVDCESGNDPYAINPAGPYYGLWQLDEDKDYVYGDPYHNTAVAYALYVADGAGHWPTCGQYFYLSQTSSITISLPQTGRVKEE